MYQSYKMDLAGRPLVVDINRVGKQANGCAFMHYGDTTVLCTATASEKPRDGIDFFPLSVEYEEKMYAVGKIPGGFNKREGKASENAILTSRVIDRPMRPLFPKDYRNERGSRVSSGVGGYDRCSYRYLHFRYSFRWPLRYDPGRHDRWRVHHQSQPGAVEER